MVKRGTVGDGPFFVSFFAKGKIKIEKYVKLFDINVNIWYIETDKNL